LGWRFTHDLAERLREQAGAGKARIVRDLRHLVALTMRARCTNSDQPMSNSSVKRRDSVRSDAIAALATSEKFSASPRWVSVYVTARFSSAIRARGNHKSSTQAAASPTTPMRMNVKNDRLLLPRAL